MADAANNANALLERYAAFYAEVARVKHEAGVGRLAIYLTEGKDAGEVEVSSDDLAAMVSYRLKNLLGEQARSIRGRGTDAEVKAHQYAQYAMAAQADELFLLELDWPGRERWELYLLEQALFGTTTAGRDFFVYLDKLLQQPARGPLQKDLAAVFLMALRLGFKGEHRGRRGEQVLAGYRRKLLQLIGVSGAAAATLPGFPQAYEHTLREAREQRLAPLSRWYVVGALGVALYLLLSTALWVYPIGNAIEDLAQSRAEIGAQTLARAEE